MLTSVAMARGFIPPARAVLTAIGVRMATVALLDIKVVIRTLTRVNTVTTMIPLGLSPRILSTVWPISSPAPEALIALVTAIILATIQIISPVRPRTSSGTVITPK